MSASAPPPLRLDLPTWLKRAWRERRRLLLLHVAVAALAIAVVLLLPRRWTSAVTLVPAGRDGLSLDLSGVGVGLPGGGLSLGVGPTPQDQLKMVVSSRAVADSLIARFGLQRRWNLARLDQARQRLAEQTTITTPKEGQVEVAVEAESPALARDLAAGFAHYVGSESVRLKSSIAATRRLYLEARLGELETEIGTASGRVRDFEETHGAVSLPDQTRETMNTAGQIQGQVALLETELAAARRYFTDQAPEVLLMRDRIDELKRQLARLLTNGGTLLLKGRELPALKQEYLKLSREQVSLTEVSELLRRVYEQARVEESNQVPSFSVLDAAELPEHHSWPKRGVTVALALALSMAASLGEIAWRESRSPQGTRALAGESALDAAGETRRAA